MPDLGPEGLPAILLLAKHTGLDGLRVYGQIRQAALAGLLMLRPAEPLHAIRVRRPLLFIIVKDHDVPMKTLVTL
ncbi:MAG: hypothetical protein ACREF9_16715 [Opitutaceae bacterium]